MDVYLYVLLITILSYMCVVSGRSNSIAGCEDIEDKLEAVSDDLIRLQGRFIEQEMLIDRQSQVCSLSVVIVSLINNNNW